MNQIKCPKCKSSDFWKTKDGRLKCKKCRYLFTPRENIFNIPNELLKQIVSEFILEHSTDVILQRVKISKYKLLKVLIHLRRLMEEDIPEIFNSIVSSKSEPAAKIEKPIIGILSKDDKIFAKILNIEPQEVEEFLKNEEKVDKNEKWLENFAIIYKNSFYRLSRKEPSQIDTLEIFWGYLKRKLFTKAGIRKERLPLYLGEYVWRFNNRKLNLKEKEERIWQLIMKK
jgi:transposase-like protein